MTIKELNQDELPVRIVKDTKYAKMYRLQWSDKSVSIRYFDPNLPPMENGGPHTYGLYNYSRACDILKNYREYRHNMTLRWQNSFTDAFSDG